MKKYAVVFMFVILYVISFGMEKIKIGYFNNEPHISFNKNKANGHLVDYWEKQIAPQMGVEIEWIGPLTPARLLDMLKKGQINAVALLAKNEEREKIYDYPEMPFHSISGGISVLKNGKIKKIDDVSMLKGLNITFFKDGYVPPIIKDVGINWDFLYTPDWKIQGLSKVLAKRVDGIFDPDMSALDYYISTKKEFKENIITLEVPNSQSENYSVFSKNDRGKFLKLYNDANNKIIKHDKKFYKKLLESIK